MSFSSNGQLLEICSNNLKVLLWDTATGVLLQTLEGHSDLVGVYKGRLD